MSASRSLGSRRDRSGLKRRRTFPLRPIRRHKRQTRIKRYLRATKQVSTNAKTALTVQCSFAVVSRRSIAPITCTASFRSLPKYVGSDTDDESGSKRLKGIFMRSATLRLSHHPLARSSAFCLAHSRGTWGNCFEPPTRSRIVMPW
jgi:hypothetical protein